MGDFAKFYVKHFPLVYMTINSNYFSDENFEYYKTSLLNVLLQAKKEKQKVIILLDLFECDTATFEMKNILKQASFYKSIMEYSKTYIQHVYILSNRTDLHFFVKIFRTFGKTDVPYKIVRNLDKIKKNIYKKYGENVDLTCFTKENLLLNKENIVITYIYDVNNVEKLELKECSEEVCEMDLNIEYDEEMDENDSDEESPKIKSPNKKVNNNSFFK